MAAEMNPPAAAPAGPASDIKLEAGRVATAAHAAGLTLRLTGGVAVALRSPSASGRPLARAYADIDCVAVAKERRQLAELMTELGYEADARFNALHGESRQYYWDPINGRQVDVFLDRIEMCHVIDLRRRLTVALDALTLPLADLLVMKLQIVETNDKDLRDLVALLVDHDLTEDDDTGINLRYLCELTSRDWGLWRTTTMVARRTVGFARTLPGFCDVDRVATQVERYLTALDSAPKTRGWRLRASIGDRKRWYELPEEVH
jgi:hypothetical protein